MKRTIILLALMAATINVNAQWFDFSSNKNRIDFGFNLGANGVNCPYVDFGFGVGFNITGFYFDFLYSNPAHQYDNHVLPVLYDDTSALSINFGYQIPVLPWLRIMPLIGYTNNAAGITDASTVNVDVSDDHTASVYHDFDVTRRFHYFNYGCGLIIQPFRWVMFNAVYSRHAIYGGLSFDLQALFNNAE